MDSKLFNIVAYLFFLIMVSVLVIGLPKVKTVQKLRDEPTRIILSGKWGGIENEIDSPEERVLFHIQVKEREEK